MKFIVKQPEPQELLEWKASDKMFQRGNPKWNRLTTGQKEFLRRSLMQEQGYICCYCENRLTIGDCHNEHIKPKGIAAYESLQLDYDNLICSCQLELVAGQPLHCGNRKGSWFVEQEFVSPLHADCERRFAYSYDGEIKPVDNEDIPAKKTIDKLSLNIPKLNALRKAAIEPFLFEMSEDELTVFVSIYLAEKDQNNGMYNPFFTTIRYLFGDI